MDINVFLLCYNESVMIPHTVKHYKTYFPSCKITIYDNESTDDSVEIAKKLGCSVISWNSNNCIDDFKYVDIKNNCWKSVESGWIIMADMDEFLCVTEEELLKEKNLGTTILEIYGFDMIGESETTDLTDIDLQQIKKCVYNHYLNKKLCFLREKITDIDYGLGCHDCKPKGEINYSSTIYLNKHMKMLGLQYFTNIIIARHERSENMRNQGFNIHYISDIEKIKETYLHAINNCKIMM